MNNNKNLIKKIELLSPVGSFEGLRCAVYNGADAVYLGLDNFNARGNIENFTMDNLKDATTFAHLFGVKVYLTLNTLVKDEEFESVINYVNSALENKVDINFYSIDITKPLENMYDIIISNPPYIPRNGYVAENVLKYEPHIALFADEEGIYFYKKIIKNNLNKLNKNGFMAFEIGDNEENLLEEFLKEEGIINYKFECDLTNRIRYLFIFNE